MTDKYFAQRELAKEFILEALKSEPLTFSEIMKSPGLNNITAGVLTKAIEHLILDGKLKKIRNQRTRANQANFLYGLKDRNLLDELYAPLPTFKGEPSMTNLIDVDPYFGGSGLSCGIVKTGIQSGFAMMDLYGFDA